MNWTLTKYSDHSAQWYEYNGRAYQAIIDRRYKRYRWGVWLANDIAVAWNKAKATGTDSNLKRAKRAAASAIEQLLIAEWKEVAG